MEDNLYAPPKSRVFDLEPLSTDATSKVPPRAVKISIATTSLSCVVGLAVRLVAMNWARMASVAVVTGFGIVVAIMLGIGYAWLLALYRGRNWARWLWLVNFILGLALVPFSLSRFSTTWERAMYLVECAVQIFATILLFLPSSNQWFTRHKKPRV